ncbi:MAG: hypothetical protein JXR90_10635 [Spirochaetes bacterium]|nr:hypothetical protein [Spirochaetota bacterium]
MNIKKLLIAFVLAGVLTMTGCGSEETKNNTDSPTKLQELGIKYDLTTEEGYQKAISDPDFLNKTFDKLTPEETTTTDKVSTGIWGDVDSDGRIMIIDSMLTARYYLGMEVEYFDASVADVNADREIDISDSLLIAQYYVGQITVFPIEKILGRNDPGVIVEDDDYYVVGGDILLSKKDPNHQEIIKSFINEDEQAQTGVSGSKGVQVQYDPGNERSVQLWTDTNGDGFAEVYFQFLNKNDTANLYSKDIDNIYSAMLSIEKVCKVKFIESAHNEGYIRIYRRPYNDNRTSSCTLGKTRESRFNIRTEDSIGIIVHELMHGLGIGHEHQRHDRDQYITMLYENMNCDSQTKKINFWPYPETARIGHVSYFLVVAFPWAPAPIPVPMIAWKIDYTNLPGSKTYGPYDYDSIMHYDLYPYSKEGFQLQTIDAHGAEDFFHIGQRFKLSQGDIFTLQSLYGAVKNAPNEHIVDNTYNYKYYYDHAYWFQKEEPYKSLKSISMPLPELTDHDKRQKYWQTLEELHCMWTWNPKAILDLLEIKIRLDKGYAETRFWMDMFQLEPKLVYYAEGLTEEEKEELYGIMQEWKLRNYEAIDDTEDIPDSEENISDIIDGINDGINDGNIDDLPYSPGGPDDPSVITIPVLGEDEFLR